MTALTSLRGVRRSVRGSVEGFENDAEDLGWRCIVLDSSEVEDKESFLDLCADSFALPEWFGLNWDALEECLVDLDREGGRGVVVVWTSWSEFADAAPGDFATALDVFASSVRTWHAEGQRGGVLLVGDGPDLDLDEL